MNLRDLITAEPSRTEYVTPPFPKGTTPVAVDPKNDGTGPLPQATVLVVPWTAAEALATSRVLTPGMDSTNYTKYTHNYAALTAGISKEAPAVEEACTAMFWGGNIGDVDYLVAKSELHWDQDGAAMPLLKWWPQVIAEVQPKVIITTGTAGGVGVGTALGDVIVTSRFHFDAQRSFASKTWAHDEYALKMPTRPHHLTLMENDLLPVNASRLPQGVAGPPKVLYGSNLSIVSTDFFCFDTTDDFYGLRSYDKNCRAVEMGDTVGALVVSQMSPDTRPVYVGARCASDPCITATGSITAEAKQAADIYLEYGFDAQIGAALACWAIIQGLS